MKQWCMQCNRMTEHGTGGCLEHNVEIHITDHTIITDPETNYIWKGTNQGIARYPTDNREETDG